MLIRMAEQGSFLEAVPEFYAEDAPMQENNQPPRAGLAALLENERRVLASLKNTHQPRGFVSGRRGPVRDQPGVSLR
jgi:hypothetical protein